MAKAKNKRNSGLADKVHGKRKADANKKKLNPFEVHINREKIKVLGKKSKHDRGLPGVSRAKAILKRKETLGTEMRLMNKTNTFVDRRIGEKDKQISAEDKVVARFAAERAKQHSKKNLFNLADDEVLTHRGQTLEQIEKFDDPRSSDDEDDDGRKAFGGLGDEFVAEGHFGGGVLSRSTQDGAKSHKDLIEQLIAESKKRKAEKQREKEQTLDLTEKLDSEWKDLQPVVLKRARVDEKEDLVDALLGQADYDKAMRELRFEKRGTPSDGLKSEEQQAKEDRQKLEHLEMERQQRMLGEEDDNTVRVKQLAKKHRSAEDLDDNFELDDETDFMLAYDKDGNPLVPDGIFQANNVPNSKKQFNDGVSDSSSDEDDDNEDDGDDDKGDESGDESGDSETEAVQEEAAEIEAKSLNITEKATKKEPKNVNNTNKTPTKDVKAVESNKTENTSTEEPKTLITTDKSDTKTNKPEKKDTSILFQDQNDNENDEKSDEDGSSEGDESDDETSKTNDFTNLNDLRESDNESGDEIEDDDEISEKINSFFDMKSTEGDNLKELLTGKTPAQQSLAIQKVIKSYDPSKGENNKELLSRLFAHLLQYINDIFINLKEECDVIKAFLIFDKLAPHLYDLAQTNKVSTKKYLVEVLQEKHQDFKRRPKTVPDLDTLIFFKLVSLIYPTSDFKHPVTTPSLVFMSEILTLSRFRDVFSISRGLFVTALVLEYTVLSKRLLPSALNFLRGILYLTANTSILNPIQLVPPFRLHREIKLLLLEEDCSKMASENKMAAKDLVLKSSDNGFKIRCLSTCVDMIKEFFDNFNDIEAQGCLFEPHIQLLSRVDAELYPKKLSEKISETLKYMKQSLEVKTYTPLVKEKKKPKALRMYEPDIQEVFTGGKNWKLDREQAESKKLEHKYKKEMKGALREIRRDKSYIASVKIRQKLQGDAIRKEKVKQIYKDASIQQGELNKLKRMK